MAGHERHTATGRGGWIRLRKGDELRELAEVINQALVNLERAFVEVRDREAIERMTLRRVVDEMRTEPSANQGRLEQFELALKEGNRIDEIFKKFRFSDF